MAINYGLLDSTIPAQIGALPGNALATYFQRRREAEDRALTNERAETQNALARMQLTRGQRDLDEEDAYRKALSGVQGGNYEAAMPDLMKASPARALAFKKSLADEQRAGLETTLKRFEFIDRVAAQFAANPTRQTGVWVLSQLAASGTPPEVIQEMSAKLNAARDEDLPKMSQAFLMATREGAKAQIEKLAPKPAAPTNLARLIAERDAFPEGDPRRAAYDQAITRETTHSPPQGAPYFTALPSGEGYLSFNNRTAETRPIVVGGKTPVRASDDPALQRRLAEGKAGGKVAGEDAAKARVDLPRASAQADELLRLTDELIRHPGFKQAVGTSSALGVQKVPGTDARDFVIRLDQIKGKQFLEAFNSLKGGGQITEAEGKKATEAIARMDIAASEPEFIQAVRDFQAVVRAGAERAAARAAPAAAPQAESKPAGMDNMPPPTEHTGRIIRDSATGLRYRSDGQRWVRVE